MKVQLVQLSGVTIRFGRLPRIIHSIFGDALLVAGAIGAVAWGAPTLLLLSGGIWSVLALVLPIEAAEHESDTSRGPGDTR